MPNQITTPDKDVNATRGQQRYNDFATATMTAKSANSAAQSAASIDKDTTQLIANTDELESLIRSTNSALSAISSKLDTIIANQG